MHVSAEELLLRERTLPVPEVVRWLAEICDALGQLTRQGIQSGLDLGNVRLSRDPTEVAVVEPRSLDAKTLPARWHVREVGSLGYQLLKGAPPAFPLNEEAFEGIPSELAKLLVQTLSGSGPATTFDLAAALRGLRLPSQAPRRQTSDTVLKARKQDRRDRTGELFGQFELVRLLGEGGMGDVYLARHVRLSREVAIKLLKPEFAAIPDLVQRFFQEAAVVNEIRHPHIVQIQDFVEEPGRVYCVMELLEGLNLFDLAEREGPLPLARICFLVVQVCDALHAAHLREVVHRDIKPENVFISRGPDGRDFARVLDFGIARRTAAGTGTQAGQVMGTPQYMAPEQAAGRTVDARADLYSLGVMLFELISNTSIMTVGTPVLPSHDARGNAVPEDLRLLVESLLSLDPKGRPGSADEVRVRLLPHAQGASSSALSPAAPARPPLPHAPTGVVLQQAGLGSVRWKLWATAGAGLVALLTLGALMLSPARQAPAPPPVAMVAPADVAQVEKPVEPPVVPPLPPPLPVAVDPPPTEPLPVKRPPPPSTHHKPPVAPVEPPPRPATNALKGRVDSIQYRYRALLEKYGSKGLTSLERETCQQVLDEARQGLDTVRPESVQAGEDALKMAELRLNR